MTKIEKLIVLYNSLNEENIEGQQNIEEQLRKIFNHLITFDNTYSDENKKEVREFITCADEPPDFANTVSNMNEAVVAAITLRFLLRYSSADLTRVINHMSEYKRYVNRFFKELQADRRRCL